LPLPLLALPLSSFAVAPAGGSAAARPPFCAARTRSWPVTILLLPLLPLLAPTHTSSFALPLSTLLLPSLPAAADRGARFWKRRHIFFSAAYVALTHGACVLVVFLLIWIEMLNEYADA
jgi:hypothetical protein